MKVLKPREAMKIARSLGWAVAPKRRTGEILYVSPQGVRYTSMAPGRTNRVPAVLAKALLQGKED